MSLFGQEVEITHLCFVVNAGRWKSPVKQKIIGVVVSIFVRTHFDSPRSILSTISQTFSGQE